MDITNEFSTDQITASLRQLAIDYPCNKVSELLLSAADKINILEEKLNEYLNNRRY